MDIDIWRLPGNNNITAIQIALQVMPFWPIQSFQKT